jgi:hypothetical protein
MKQFSTFLMGCYFCLPGDKTEIKTLEADPILASYELRNFPRSHQRLYTVREEPQETSECSELKLNIDLSR